jgi:hypothetical protein
VLVEQSGLKLELKEPVSTDPKLPVTVPPVTMSISFSLYGRPAGSKPEPAAFASGGVPAGSGRPANP